MIKDVESFKGPLIKGWDFSIKEYKTAWKNHNLLTTQIELTNLCNLKCEYCYRAEQGPFHKMKLKNELNLDEIKKIIKESTTLGTKAINIIGAGEPTIDKNLPEVIKYIYKCNATPILATNGFNLSGKLLKILNETESSIIIKVNSFNKKIQDAITFTPGYTEKRNSNLKKLLDLGFNKETKKYKTRLGINAIVCKNNEKDILEVFRFCRKNNIMPIMSTFIPEGRTKNRTDLEATFKEFSKLQKKIKKIDRDEFKINYKRNLPYLGGVPCTQNSWASLYIDVTGEIFECSGRLHPLGNVKNTSLKKALEKRRKIKNNSNFCCPPRLEYWERTNQL